MDLTAPLFFIAIILLTLCVFFLTEMLSLKNKSVKKNSKFPELGSIWRYKKSGCEDADFEFFDVRYHIVGHITKDCMPYTAPLNVPNTVYAVSVRDLKTDKEEDIELSLFLSLCEPDV